MNQNLASQPISDEDVIKLKCPDCGGGLNLRRKHLGIRGKCVHCKVAVIAVEENGSVILKRADEPVAPKPETPPVAETPPVVDTPPVAIAEESVPPALKDEAAVSTSQVSPPPLPAAVAAVEEESSQFIPPPIPTEVAPVEEEESKEESPASAWGFPQRDFSEEGQNAAAVEAAPVEALAEEPSPEEPVKLEEPPRFGFSEAPANEPEAMATAEERREEETASLPTTNPSDLFETSNATSDSALFSSPGDSGEVNSGWGAKVPNQNHASISPFSTGSAEPDPGLAETLFREKAKEETGKIQPKSPFAELDGQAEAPQASGALFSSPIVPSTPKTGGAKPEQEKEVLLDGDGRPLREMTPEEKEQFAQDIMHFGDYHKRSPWIKRIVRFVMTIIVLGGLGYAAYVFMPEEQVKVAREKVFDWLEPGSVLMQYLPFDIAENENGEREVKIKALEGLDNLSTQMDSYLSTAEEQLNETLPEGAEGYMREEPIDMPEMPKLPNIPGLKMPSMPSAAAPEESTEEAE